MKLDAVQMFSDYFEDEFMIENKDNMNDIIKHISECNNEFILKNRTNGEVLEFVRNRIDEPNYKIDNRIEIIDNGIIVPFCFKKFWDLIKNSIPRKIKKISIPLHDVKIDVSLFSEFKDLEEIELNDYGVFDENDMKYLNDNTSVKKINARNIYSLKGKENTTYTDGIIVYGNILINDIDREEEYKDELYIETLKINASQIEKIIKCFPNIKKVFLIVNEDRYSITINNKDVIIEVTNNETNNKNEVDELFKLLGYIVK
ncbi:MAG: hypothetical protein IKR57_06185 [Bacilli bacterium]|nr:hypothetical protein [Bacilli bacterium]